MEKVTLFDKTFVPLIPNRDIVTAIDAVSREVNSFYQDSEDIPVVLCILNGALLFASELLQRLNFNLEVMCVKLSSYQGTSSTGQVKEISGITGSVKGRRVLVVEDIVDTGNTVEYITKSLREKGATEVKICTLLLKPEVYERDVPMDFVAMEIPNRFIVGYGLDYNEIGRNLKDIYVLEK